MSANARIPGTSEITEEATKLFGEKSVESLLAHGANKSLLALLDGYYVRCSEVVFEASHASTASHTDASGAMHRIVEYSETVRNYVEVVYGGRSFEFGLALVGSNDLIDVLRDRLDSLGTLSALVDEHIRSQAT